MEPISFSESRSTVVALAPGFLPPPRNTVSRSSAAVLASFRARAYSFSAFSFVFGSPIASIRARKFQT